MISLTNKRFRLTSNSNVRDLGSNTILTVNQDGGLLYGNYNGGKVLQGNFIAKLLDATSFEKTFHHYNDQGNLISGKSNGTIERLIDGRIRLRESWNSEDYSGDAIYDEVREVQKGDFSDDYYYLLSLNK